MDIEKSASLFMLLPPSFFLLLYVCIPVSILQFLRLSLPLLLLSPFLSLSLSLSLSLFFSLSIALLLPQRPEIRFSYTYKPMDSDDGTHNQDGNCTCLVPREDIQTETQRFRVRAKTRGIRSVQVRCKHLEDIFISYFYQCFYVVTISNFSVSIKSALKLGAKYKKESKAKLFVL